MAKLPSRPADPVTRYAMEVVDGKVVACRYVCLACEPLQRCWLQALDLSQER